MIASLSKRTIIFIAAASLLLVAFAVRSCVETGKADAVARQERNQNEAVSESVNDANNASVTAETRITVSRDQVKEDQDEVHKANDVSAVTRVGAERLRAQRDRERKPESLR